MISPLGPDEIAYVQVRMVDKNVVKRTMSRLVPNEVPKWEDWYQRLLIVNALNFAVSFCHLFFKWTASLKFTAAGLYVFTVIQCSCLGLLVFCAWRMVHHSELSFCQLFVKQWPKNTRGYDIVLETTQVLEIRVIDDDAVGKKSWEEIELPFPLPAAMLPAEEV